MKHATAFLTGLLILLIPWGKLEILDRITWAEVAFLLLAGAVIVELLRGRLKLRKLSIPRGFVVVVGLWLIGLLLSGIHAAHRGPWLFETAGMAYVSALGILIAVVVSVDEEAYNRSLKWLTRSSIIVLIVGSLGILKLGITLQRDFFFQSRSGKLIATFAHSNQLAGFLVLLVPLFWELYVMARGRRRIAYGGLLLTLILGIVFTASRSAIAVLMAIALFYLVRYLLRREFRVLIVPLVAGAILVGMMFVLRHHFAVVERVVGFVGNELLRGQLTDSFRVTNWENAIALFRTSPLTGYGLANVWMDYVNEIHNTYVSALAETGIIGLATLMFLFGYITVLGCRVVAAARRLRPSWSPYARALLVGVLGQFLFGTQHIVYRGRHLWLFFGLIVAMWTLLRRRRSTPQGRSSTRAGSSGDRT